MAGRGGPGVPENQVGPVSTGRSPIVRITLPSVGAVETGGFLGMMPSLTSNLRDEPPGEPVVRHERSRPSSAEGTARPHAAEAFAPERVAGLGTKHFHAS